jgi:hypothetical protein
MGISLLAEDVSYSVRTMLHRVGWLVRGYWNQLFCLNDDLAIYFPSFFTSVMFRMGLF